jgi:hypothetical protein
MIQDETPANQIRKRGNSTSRALRDALIVIGGTGVIAIVVGLLPRFG